MAGNISLIRGDKLGQHLANKQGSAFKKVHMKSMNHTSYFSSRFWLGNIVRSLKVSLTRPLVFKLEIMSAVNCSMSSGGGSTSFGFPTRLTRGLKQRLKGNQREKTVLFGGWSLCRNDVCGDSLLGGLFPQLLDRIPDAVIICFHSSTQPGRVERGSKNFFNRASHFGTQEARIWLTRR